VSDDDDGPGRPGRGYIHDGDDGGPSPVPSNEQPARWRTIESPLAFSAVQERLRAALRPRQPFVLGPVLGGTEQARGFIVRFKSRSRVRFGEIQLGGWESGTQVQVLVPAENTPADCQVLADWVQRVLKAS
jgi:hypothetical protein